MNPSTQCGAFPRASGTKDCRWVWLFCCLAALRVLVYAAAFPFFNNVDEEMHFDVALKYSHGGTPQPMSRISAEAARDIVLYGSPEYLTPTNDFVTVPPPAWAQPREKIKNSLRLEMEDWQARTNYESSSPPLYYLLAGAWLSGGRHAGIEGLSLLYWVRFLNVLVIGALVWLGYLAACAVFPESRFICLGLPALLAFWPQDCFYSIQTDVLSPLCFGAAFVGLLRWSQTGTPTAKLAGLTGLALAAGCLVKASNLPLLAVGLVMFFLCVRELRKQDSKTILRPSIGAFLVCALLPVVLLCAWNLHTSGDITGSAAKAQTLGWTSKPFADWWSHPIFTLGGFWTFCRGLLLTFWRGEFIWRGLPMSRPAVELFYAIFPIAMFLCALGSLFPRLADSTRAQRRALLWSFASVGACFVFLGLLSVMFDFGDCPYPSRDYPYFASGRLLSGAAIPLFLVLLRGLDWLLNKQGPRAKWMALMGIILLMVVSEIVVSHPVFASQYNWFHR